MMTAALAGAQVLDSGRARAGQVSEPVGLLLADAGYLSEDNLTVEGRPADRDRERRQAPAAAQDGRPPPTNRN